MRWILRTARALLGSLYFSGGLVDEAIGEWQRARALRPEIPTLHRNLGLALLLGKDDAEEARRVFVEGVARDPRNVEIYDGLDRVIRVSYDATSGTSITRDDTATLGSPDASVAA